MADLPNPPLRIENLLIRLHTPARTGLLDDVVAKWLGLRHAANVAKAAYRGLPVSVGGEVSWLNQGRRLVGSPCQRS